MQATQNYTVIGAGHGGKAMAADLALMGFKVTLYNRTEERIAAIKARRGIDLESYDLGRHGFGRLAKVTSDVGEATLGADLLMVVVPSSAHADIAKTVGATPARRPDHRVAPVGPLGRLNSGKY